MPRHNPENKEYFISFAEAAKALEDYYIPHYGKDVYVIYGRCLNSNAMAEQKIEY